MISRHAGVSSMEERTNSKGNVHGVAALVKNIDGKPNPPRGILKNPKVQGIKEATVTGTMEDKPKSHEVKSDVEVQHNLSYATKLRGDNKAMNFRFLEPKDVLDDVVVVLPPESVQLVQNRFTNTLYGYFLGNRLAFPVVEDYVKNAWKKYGINRSMMNSNGFFFFQFSTKEGMQAVLEGGPWLIRKIPMFLNVWTPTSELRKEGIKKVVVWVKIHNVPMAAYTEDGLSMLASKIGMPKALDSYTSTMCMESWGRSSFARALIELSAESELKENLSLAIPKADGEGYIKETMNVEYE